jgi:hypothetical protein
MLGSEARSVSSSFNMGESEESCRGTSTARKKGKSSLTLVPLKIQIVRSTGDDDAPRAQTGLCKANGDKRGHGDGRRY